MNSNYCFYDEAYFDKVKKVWRWECNNCIPGAIFLKEAGVTEDEISHCERIREEEDRCELIEIRNLIESSRNVMMTWGNK